MVARTRDKAAQEHEEGAGSAADGVSAPTSRELKSLARRGKLQIVEPVPGQLAEQRLTRSRSRTPMANTPSQAEPARAPVASTETDSAEIDAKDLGSAPPAVQRRQTQTNGVSKGSAAETGQGLSDQAVSALAKALKRSSKRTMRKASREYTGDKSGRSADEQAGVAVGGPQKSAAARGKGILIELPSSMETSAEAARAAPKRRKLGAPTKNPEEPAEESDDESEWEPDWESDQAGADEDDDEAIDDFVDTIEIDSEDDDPLSAVPLKDRLQSAAATGSFASSKAQKSAKKVAAAAKSKARQMTKDKDRQSPAADSDSDVWETFTSDMEEEAPYVPKVLEPMEPPRELLLQLLPYQKEFLGWAVRQEQGDIKGGILADEMGMGKTIQAISLVVAHRTDDDSKLPSLASGDEAKQKEQPKDRKRPKLRLHNVAFQHPAAKKPKAAAEGVGEELAAGPAKMAVIPEQAAVIHKEDTVAPDLAAEDAAAAANLEKATSLKERPSQAPPMMAVGDSCCGTEDKAAAAPSGAFSRATLVICPVVAIIQWRQEIDKYVEPGTLKIVVYHGGKRATSKEELENADVVLTTYSIAEGEFRRHNQPDKCTCTYCGKKFYPDRLKVHLRFFCGPNAKKSAALAKQQKKRPAAGKKHSEDTAPSDAEEAEEGEPVGAKASGSNKPAKGKGKTSAAKENTFKAGKRKRVPGDEEEARPKGEGAAEKGKKAPASKRRKGDPDADDSGFNFSAESEAEESDDTEGSSDSDEAGPSRGRMRPKRVRNGAGWEERAMAEAEKMIAESERRNSRAADTGKSILHEVRWRRIILDEAHSIKDRRSSTARSIFALDSKYKWALSGTPLQNRVSELYSLVRFLRIFPYAYYFCNQGHSKTAKKVGKGQPCTCKSLDYSFASHHRKCDHCGHSPLHHYCYWNKWVANPIKKFGYIGKGRLAMRLLKSEILEKILLRRTKVQCADVLALPPRTQVLRKDQFDEREEDFYEALYTQSQAQFDAYVQTSTVLNNYAHVFSLLVRLRQAVNHPYLVVHSSTAPGAGGGAAGQEGSCSICHDPLEDGIAASCGHAFCRACITEYMEAATSAAKCTACDKPLTIDLANAPPARSSRVAGSRKDSIINRISLANFQSSTKIEALREELERMQQRDPSGKAIVFSQFTSMLDLIFFRLEQVGIKCVRLEGSMTIEQRNRMIDAFTNNASVRVFLMSLKAGGVALNLTAASHVMLMDPWWNPAVEEQAQDRIHRLGQYKPIHVTRFVIGGTIEERILKLQAKKKLVFEGTVGRDSDALGRLTEDDLRFLFG